MQIGKRLLQETHISLCLANLNLIFKHSRSMSLPLGAFPTLPSRASLLGLLPWIVPSYLNTSSSIT